MTEFANPEMLFPVLTFPESKTLMIGYIAGALTTIAFSPPASKSPNFEIYKKCISYDAALLDFGYDPLAALWNFDQ